MCIRDRVSTQSTGDFPTDKMLALPLADSNNRGGAPAVPGSAWVAPGATLIGGVSLGEGSSVWFGCVLRADADCISVGAGSNIQDLTMVHCDPGKPLRIGDRVTVGHKALLHGCTIEDDCLIGMGAIIMNDAHIGTGSIVGAGAVVLEGFACPSYSLVVGSPAKLKKSYSNDISNHLNRIRTNAASYQARAQYYKQNLNLDSNSSASAVGKVVGVVAVGLACWLGKRALLY
eukprot:TRINITY_DN39935_c0_g1_i1.p1 TRINITY_DN39935_c0_g1~~TRINITY_DN39935_c0_g1_i1.p1  ORF type:complete len:231 (+),score=38.09 TRINITY_DN39935_c0_g1_i1:155-847(+)